jgi:putative addiction module component (TIGR02574 family)
MIVGLVRTHQHRIGSMTKRTQQVLREALQLPPRARADIAATLLHSLDETEDSQVEAAWADEIKRRIEDVEAGRVKLIPWQSAKRRLQLRIRRARQKA